jgi:transcriptional regulator with XRE-family HTH domain
MQPPFTHHGPERVRTEGWPNRRRLEAQPRRFRVIGRVQSICNIMNLRNRPSRLDDRIDPALQVEKQMATALSRILDHLRDDGGLQGRDIANIVAVSPATVLRWSNGKATPDLRTQTVIADLHYVVDRLGEFYTPAETRLWLHARHPMLEGERAVDLINAARTEPVLAIIEGLDSGAYT